MPLTRLKNGRIVDPANGVDAVADLCFEDGCIVAAPHGRPADREIDCAGMVLMGKQKGLDAATPLNIQPRYIGVPLEYQTTAYQILFGQLYAATADNAVPAWRVWSASSNPARAASTTLG